MFRGRRDLLIPPAFLSPAQWKKGVPFATALRETLKQGYTQRDFRADLVSGLVVGIVALPLSMAFAIAANAPPERGLTTAIIAGAIVALTGGSRLQISGPTSAFAILAPVVTKYGLSGLVTASFLAGLLLLLMGVFRLGKLIQFIPHPVTSGFTSGIALLIAVSQLKDATGIRTEGAADGSVERIVALWHGRSTFKLSEFAMCLATFAFMALATRFGRKLPAPLVGLVLATVTGVLVHRFAPWISFDTIGTRFKTVIDGHAYSGIPPVLPRFSLPWSENGLTYTAVRELTSPALAIAMLVAMESLLSAVVADGMTGGHHDPDAELIGLGIGNVVASLFGGIAATGALARTATNVRAGARTPFSAVFCALVILVSTLLLAPLVAYVPMAALAALLLIVAKNMAEFGHLAHMTRFAPRSDLAVLGTCFALTILTDMIVAVTVGVLLSAVLFIRRMAELTQGRAVLPSAPNLERFADRADRVAIYEIAGPLFFGAAQRAMAMLDAVGDRTRVVILDLSRVPAIDATGLVALESVISRLTPKREIILAGPLPEPREAFDRSGITERVRVATSLDDALNLAEGLVQRFSTPPPPMASPGSIRPRA